MSILQQPPIRPDAAGRSPDNLDGLLRAFYRAEMPDPWPALQPSVSREVVPFRPTNRWSSQRSRWVLAASVVLLLISQLFLSGQLPDYSAARTAGEVGDTTARRNLSGLTHPGKAAPVHKGQLRDSSRLGVEEGVHP